MRSTRQRDLPDRLVVRVPALAGLIAGAVFRAKPGSSLRRRLVNLQVKRGFAAMARSDVELVVLSYDPAAEVWMRSMAGVGISDCYRGHDGVRALYADIDEAFHDWEWTIRGVADGGDPLTGRFRRLRTRQRGGDHDPQWRDGGEVLGSRADRLAGMVRRARRLDESPRSRGAAGVVALAAPIWEEGCARPFHRSKVLLDRPHKALGGGTTHPPGNPLVPVVGLGRPLTSCSHPPAFSGKPRTASAALARCLSGGLLVAGLERGSPPATYRASPRRWSRD